MVLSRKRLEDESERVKYLLEAICKIMLHLIGLERFMATRAL